MIPQDIFEEIGSTAKELIDKIREISRLQRSLWQQVPYLALQADGRTGYADQYMRAYRSGYWVITSSCRDGCYHVSVDLETGELVCPLAPERKSSDEDVLRIALSLHEIDVERILRKLKIASERPFHRSYKQEDKERRKRLQDSILEQGNITPDSFSRVSSSKNIRESGFKDPVLD
ncbi:MAG: hypothetical protein COV29_02475 [Candidatus Yanofskybacteria bacterium CG10_big_fil_rev_8_21_14_0_10_36_16]|uniref:Uncharacterized protein n=1 Tax=Candidatus Yanofskybacteria bacterium CG10_big_fil_rev_8_21_14_0_10_36_16 TaxID=1975096 RepID=A0A2J0Q829_9BACT|nr:MAG: hypothetical protein COV29_02475 [Candidatus Yanofskybacteria bacterium CG10_big_fil_rev_8_21_14_0_10_36_16]